MTSKFHENLFLTDTDTTVGFLSQNTEKITDAKKRLKDKHYIIAVDSLVALKTLTRVPVCHKNRMRRSKKTTFILPNQKSFRLITDEKHLRFLHRMKWAYSSSANISGMNYDKRYAREIADISIYPFSACSKPSSIYKLSKKYKARRVR